MTILMSRWLTNFFATVVAVFITLDDEYCNYNGKDDTAVL